LGDGWGFEPRTPAKLGLGFARIDGPATSPAGINIRSPDRRKARLILKTDTQDTKNSR
jgi:hypothetical protein